jgi:chromosomal replication initiator protein
VHGDVVLKKKQSMPVNKLLISESSLWDKVLERLGNRLSEGQMIWVSELAFEQVDHKTIRLTAIHDFARDRVQKHFLSDITKVLQSFAPEYKNILLEVEEKTSDLNSIPAVELKASSQKISRREVEAVPSPLAIEARRALEEKIRQKRLEAFPQKYSLEVFIKGDCNAAAYGAARQVAAHPGTVQFNPLIFWGKSGLGKTHLLKAIGRYSLEHEVVDKVQYITTEMLMQKFSQAVRRKDFSSYQRMVDDLGAAEIILIDDIQFLEGKAELQKQLFRILNDLRKQNKQIVLSCDQPWSRLKDLDANLVRNFESGLDVAIKELDLETRTNILMERAKKLPFKLRMDVISYMATHCRSDVRQLEGAMNKLLAYNEFFFTGGEENTYTVESARQVLRDVISEEDQHLSMEMICEVVAQQYGLKADMLFAKTRAHRVTLPRKVAMYLIRENLHHTFEHIALHFHRDSSTVMASVKDIAKKRSSDYSLHEQLNLLEKQL